MRGALRGCLALLSRRAPPPLASPADQQQQQAAPASTQLPAPSGEDAVEMMRACAQHVFVRALAAPDRQLALRLLAAALRSPLYGQALVAANLDLLEYAISSGEEREEQMCRAGGRGLMCGGGGAAEGSWESWIPPQKVPVHAKLDT